MDFKDTLTKIDAALGPKTKTVTKTEAEAYVKDQLAKAEAEAKDEKDKEGAGKAKKRLGHLRGVVDMLAKASWEGQSNTISIPVYEGGYEDNTAKSELSETEQKTPPPIAGTGAEGASFAAAGGAQSFAKALETISKSVSALDGTATEDKKAPVTKGEPEPTFPWPSDLSATEEVIGKEAVTKRAPEQWGRDTDKAR